MITEKAQIEAKEFRRRVKAQLALNDDTVEALAVRIGKRPNTITTAFRKPWEFPLVVAAINADLFGGKPLKKRATQKTARKAIKRNRMKVEEEAQ